MQLFLDSVNVKLQHNARIASNYITETLAATDYSFIVLRTNDVLKAVYKELKTDADGFGIINWDYLKEILSNRGIEFCITTDGTPKQRETFIYARDIKRND